MMALLADRILALPSSNTMSASHVVARRLRASLRAAVIVKADDLANALKAKMSGDRLASVPHPRDIPNLAPPFETFWVEYPSLHPADDGVRVGVFFESSEAPQPIGPICRWNVSTTIVIEDKNGPQFWPHRVGYASDEKGRWVGWGMSTLDSRGVFCDLPLVSEETLRNPELVTKYATDFVETFNVTRAAFIAIGLMHCKNVMTFDAPIHRFASREWRRKTGKDLVRHKTLRVFSPSDGRRSFGKAAMGEANFPVHMARGHFKQFSETSKLFGKYTGLYWWAPHVRGSKEAGILTKTYDIASPSAGRNKGEGQ